MLQLQPKLLHRNYLHKRERIVIRLKEINRIQSRPTPGVSAA